MNQCVTRQDSGNPEFFSTNESKTTQRVPCVDKFLEKFKENMQRQHNNYFSYRKVKRILDGTESQNIILGGLKFVFCNVKSYRPWQVRFTNRRRQISSWKLYRINDQYKIGVVVFSSGTFNEPLNFIRPENELQSATHNLKKFKLFLLDKPLTIERRH